MSSSSPTPQTDHNKNNNAGLNKQHLIIALAVGLSVVTLIIMCLLYAPLSFSYIVLRTEYKSTSADRWSLSIFVNNRHSNSDNSEHRRFRPSRSKKPKKSPSERRLRKLDAESPICTLEEWWSRAKIPPLPSDDECDQFTWCATPLHNTQGKKLIGQCNMSRLRPAKPRDPRLEMPTCVPSRVFGQMVSAGPVPLSVVSSGVL